MINHEVGRLPDGTGLVGLRPEPSSTASLGHPATIPSAEQPSWVANEYLKSPTYRQQIPFFTAAINGQEIVEALECRMYGLEASEMFLAVHWSVLREARDEIERLQWELAQRESATKGEQVMDSLEASFSQSRSDMYWKVWDPKDGFVRWIGYDDEFWWDKVSPAETFRLKVGAVTGRRYILDPDTNNVSVEAATKPASAMSASGQDPKGLGATPASAVPKGDATPTPRTGDQSNG